MKTPNSIIIGLLTLCPVVFVRVDAFQGHLYSNKDIWTIFECTLSTEVTNAWLVTISRQLRSQWSGSAVHCASNYPYWFLIPTERSPDGVGVISQLLLKIGDVVHFNCKWWTIVLNIKDLFNAHFCQLDRTLSLGYMTWLNAVTQ